MSFNGFSDDTVAFLADLAAHNDKAWFDAHKADYEAHWKDAGCAFVEAAGKRLQTFAPDVTALPKVNGSLFRLHRDVRFSKDKRPYKTHLDVMMWEGPSRKTAASGFFFRLKPDHYAVGVGAVAFEKERLAQFRDVVQHKKAAASLVDVEMQLQANGFTLDGEHYKRIPRGVEADALDDAQQRYVRFNALWSAQELPLPKNLSKPTFLDDVVAQWEQLLPLHQWMVTHLSA